MCDWWMIDVYGVIGGMIDMMTDVYVIMCMVLCVNDRMIDVYGVMCER